MSEIVPKKATICVINYKTLDLIRLCLRSIRRFTEYPCEVVVVDNDSADESLDYLKSLDWIKLIERRAEPGEPGGGYAHAAALQLALQQCRTEFFVSMHSDTIVKKPGWLTSLVDYFGNDPETACVGSGKIELLPQWRLWLKKTGDLRSHKRKLMRTPDPLGKYRYYNRTICCLYRTDILQKEKLSFLMDRDKGLTAGKKLYFELVDRGYKTVELPSSVMGSYVIHLAHATQVMNSHEFELRGYTIRKCSRLVDRVVASPAIQDILNDESLDR